MSQPTHTTSGAHEASAADQTQSAATPAKRRFRRTTARNKAAAPQVSQADQTATAAAAASETHEAPQPSQPSHAAPAAETTAEHAPPAPPAEPQAAAAAKPQQKGTRATRGRRGGRKSDVQLVAPAGAATPELPAPAEAPESAPAHTPAPAVAEQPGAGPAATEAPRVVPVVTEPAEPTVEVEPVAPAPRRYRFERRSPASAPTLVRPERLAGTAGTIAPAQPLTADQSPLAPPAEPEPTPEEEQPEAWQATVAEVAPETIDQNAAARPDVAPFDLRDRTTRQAVSDIVEALGLREGEQPAADQQALHLEPARTAEATEGDLAEGDGEEAHAEQEGEAQGTSRRRRRRRRGGGTHAVSTPEEEEHEPAAEEPPSPNGYDAYGDFGPFEQPYSPYNRPVRERLAQPPAAATAAQPWEITTGPQQVRQPESPFGSPEPSFARGFGP